MFDPESISLPDPEPYIDAELLLTLYKALGIALVVQWFIPWLSTPMGTAFSWSLMEGGAAFTMLWPLLGGGGLIALGFLPADKLGDGLRLFIGGCLAFLGLLSLTMVGGMGGPGLPMFGFFGFFGFLAVLFGLLIWLQRGPSTLAWAIVTGGAASVALWLLIPVGGTMPLVWMFKVFGFSQVNIIWRIFMFLAMALWVALFVFTVLFVILKRESASRGWIRLLFWALLLYFPVVMLVLGLMSMFTSAWFFIMTLHMLVMVVSYLAIGVVSGALILDVVLDGSVADLFK